MNLVGASSGTPRSLSCPTGLNVVGGGAQVSSEARDLVNDSFPNGRTGWQATGFGPTGDTMTVFLICAPATKTTP